MNKTTLILILVISLSLFATLSFAKNNGNGQECTQVITQAYNPSIRECRNFSTPCDVPKNWIIGNCYDIITLQENNTNTINRTAINECKKNCKVVFVNSTQLCNEAHRNAVHSCNDARNASLSQCQNLTGKEKRDCVKATVTSSKICKKSANIAKRQCKINSLLTFKSCKLTCKLD